jgi:hypothetical protein
MNKTTLSIALCAGVFTIACGGFFYRENVSRQAMQASWSQAGIAEAPAVIPVTAEDTKVAATDGLTHGAADANSASTGERRVIPAAREKIPDIHSKSASTRRSTGRERITSRARPLHRDEQSLTDGSGTEEFAADTVAAPLLAYAATDAAGDSESAPASIRAFASKRDRTSAGTDYTNTYEAPVGQ